MSLNVAYQRRLQSKYEMKVEVHWDYWYAHTPRPNRLLIKVNEPTLLTSQYQNIPYK